MTPRDAWPEDLDIALNEASWRGLLLEEENSRVEIALQVLSLPDDDGGTGTVDVVLELGRVGRLVASLRRGRWDDDNAAVIPLDAAQLGEVVASFRGAAIYGWEFFDAEKTTWHRWSDGLSVDLRWRSGGETHSIWLFQEGAVDGETRHLDFAAWFDDLTVVDADANTISLDDFAAGGRRWWEAMRRGDPRTSSSGIVPLRADADDS